MNTLINWLISAVILWLMSLVTPFIPFLYMRFAGGWLPVVIVAIVLGLINAIIVPIVKRIFKRGNNTVIILIVTVVIDAGALWLTSVIASRSFFIDFFPTAIVVALILAAVNGAFSRR